MKRGKGITINLSNKVAYTLIAIFILAVIGGVVFAYNSNPADPAVFGHSADEIEGSISCVEISAFDKGYDLESDFFITKNYAQTTLGASDIVEWVTEFSPQADMNIEGFRCKNPWITIGCARTRDKADEDSIIYNGICGDRADQIGEGGLHDIVSVVCCK
jgi:hypothetical protein